MLAARTRGRLGRPRPLTVLGLGVLLASLHGGAQQPGAADPSRADAERCQQKIDRIAQLGLEPRTQGAARQRTVLPERDMNAYLRLVMQPQLPVGVIEPAATLGGGGPGQFVVRAVFDLDAVRAQRERGVMDPLRYLGGRVPVVMDCVLRTGDGQATLELRSATVSGVTVPRFVVQELVSYATRSPDYPQGFQFDEPFPLPANIRELQVNRGEVVVVQ